MRIFKITSISLIITLSIVVSQVYAESEPTIVPDTLEPTAEPTTVVGPPIPNESPTTTSTSYIGLPPSYYTFLPPPNSARNFGVLVEDMGDVNNNNLADYLITDGYNRIQLRTPQANNEIIWSRDLQVDYALPTSDCEADGFSTLFNTGSIGNNNPSTFAVADTSASFSLTTGPGFNNVGAVCFYDALTGNYISHIAGFSFPGFFGTSVLNVGDVNNTGMEDFLIGEPASGTVFFFEGQDILNFANNFGFVPSTNQEIRGVTFGQSMDVIDQVGANTFVAIGGPRIPRFLGGIFGLGVRGSVRIIRVLDRNINAIDTLMAEIREPRRDEDFGHSVVVLPTQNSGQYKVFVGAPLADSSTGKVYIFDLFVQQYPLTFTPALNTTLTGEQINGRFGLSIKEVGDVDLDGMGDVAIVAPRYQRSGSSEYGKVYVVSGSTHNIIRQYRANHHPYQTIGGQNIVSGGSDVNNDGRSDLIIGYPVDSNNTGAALLMTQ